MIATFPRDLYFVFVLKFLESYGYFALSQVLVIYLHDEFGASDMEAGAIYGNNNNDIPIL
jgi:POT family proton-dependent oligopeptide transporter